MPKQNTKKQKEKQSKNQTSLQQNQEAQTPLKKQKFYKPKRKCGQVEQMMSETVETSKHAIKAFIGTIKQAPAHLVDNEYIRRGYRINYDFCHRSILKSFLELHNESVNVWSHLLGMILFTALIAYTCISISPMKNMTQLVAQGLDKAQQQNEHIVTYFREQLVSLQEDIDHLHSYNFQCSPDDIQTTQDQCVDSDLYGNKTNLTFSIKNETWQNKINLMVHRIEGLAHTFVTEFQDFKHYVKEGEEILEDKLHQWKDHVQHFPEELSSRIQNITKLLSQKSQEYLDEKTLNRLEYLAAAMDDFKSKMSNFSQSIIHRIDQMQWLDFQSLGGPITDVDEYMNYVSRWPLLIHMISACICLGLSSLYHSFYVYSQGAFVWLAKLDYAGISILILGSTMPMINYYYACGPALFYRRIFMALEIITCSSAFIVTLLPAFDKKENRKWRGILFVILGISSALPLFFAMAYRQPEFMMEPQISAFLIGGVVYILGACLFVTRVPERCKPGCFDYFGHSHQLFHFCVLIACFIHYRENVRTFHERAAFMCPLQ